MSKSKKSAKNPATVEQTAPVTATPVEQTTPVITSGRTIVEIAKELRITSQNARRVARKHAEILGHAGKGARWVLNADQEKALIDALTREKLVREKTAD